MAEPSNGPSPAPETPSREAQSRRWLFVLPVAIFGALALLFLFRLFAGDPSRLPSALIGRAAPPTTLPALDGLTQKGVAIPGLSTEALKGKVLVLNVFASWCGPCREEHPHLMQLAETEPYKSGRVVMAGLNYKDEGENARRFLAALGNPYTHVGVDRSGRAGIEWGVYGVPETFVVDKAGKIVHKQVGPLGPASLAKFNAAVAEALR